MADKLPEFLIRTKHRGKKTVAILYRRRPFWRKPILEFSTPQKAEKWLRENEDLKVTGYVLSVMDCRLEDGKILMKSWILTYNLLQGGSVIPMREYYYWIVEAKVAEWAARHDKNKAQVCLTMVESEV